LPPCGPFGHAQDLRHLLVCQSAGENVRPEVAAERLGDRIGRYKLLQIMGEGGCGVVYMAEQEQPVRRKVALTVIKLGMDTKNVIARFEAERQALARFNLFSRFLFFGLVEFG
jgi:hypothetical protein